MSTVQGIVRDVKGKRGRGPGTIMIQISSDEGTQSLLDFGTFDPAALREAASNIGAKVAIDYEEKKSKDGDKVYRNMSGWKILEPASRQETTEKSTFAPA